MLDARFDDLTGASASFRLVGPVGVLEATRPDEVSGTIAAAEAAAVRGLWVAGFLAYEAAPGLDPSLAVRSRALGDPFARLPLAWFAMFERREETVLPEPQRDPDPSVEGAWRPSVDRTTYDRAIGRIREHIAAGDTYQVNHTLRLRSRVQGDPRGLYRDLCFAQRGAYAAYLDLGRYRVCSASPELFFRLDDGVLTTRPMKGTAPRGTVARRGRGRRGAPARLREGPGRERDDRGPAPQRHGSDRGAGIRDVERRLRSRAVRDRVAAHLDGLGPRATRRRARGRRSEPCSRAAR